MNVTDLKTWNDILDHLCVTDDFLPYKNPLTSVEKCANALVKLITIASVYNEGWTPDWSSTNQKKYYIYKYKNFDGSWSVSALDVRDDVCSPSGAHFKSNDLALISYENFQDVYNDYLMIT